MGEFSNVLQRRVSASFLETKPVQKATPPTPEPRSEAFCAFVWERCLVCQCCVPKTVSCRSTQNRTPFCLEASLFCSFFLFPGHAGLGHFSEICFSPVHLSRGYSPTILRQFCFRCHCKQFTQDGLIWRRRIWDYFPPCRIWSEQLF